MKTEEFYHYCYVKQLSAWAETCLLVSDTMGYTAEPEFRIERKTFHNHLAFYVKQGIFYLEQYGKKYVLKQGDVGILDLNDPHVYYSDETDVAHLLWFHFRGAGIENIMKVLKQNEELPLLYYSPIRELDFLELFRLTKNKVSETELSGKIYEILMKCLQDSFNAGDKAMKIPEELGYLDTGYFRKVFRNHFGITPAVYRKNIL